MVIEKIMSIGGACESFIFSDIFNKRITSPLDTFGARNFKSLLNIFNGTLFNDILNDNILKVELNPYRKYYSNDKDFFITHDDLYLRYYSLNNNEWCWCSGHINFEQQKRKEEFKRRIQLFDNFKEEIINNNKYFYLYSISQFEDTLSKEDFEYTYNNLPKYVIDNLIILGSERFKIPSFFNEKFRCISFNLNLNGENEIRSLWEKY